MPLPKPEKNEKEKQFIKRCIKELSDEDQGKRWPDNKQRVAICFNIWNENGSENIENITEKGLKMDIIKKIDFILDEGFLSNIKKLAFKITDKSPADIRKLFNKRNEYKEALEKEKDDTED